MPTIKLFANLRKLTGKKEITIPGASIQEVLERLAQEFPELEQFLLKEGQLRPRGIITVNGQSIDPAASLQTPVSEQDQIAVFPPISGG